MAATYGGKSYGRLEVWNVELATDFDSGERVKDMKRKNNYPVSHWATYPEVSHDVTHGRANSSKLTAHATGVSRQLEKCRELGVQVQLLRRKYFIGLKMWGSENPKTPPSEHHIRVLST
jgi:hypothetical protein